MTPKQKLQQQWSWNKKILSGMENQLVLLRAQYENLKQTERSRTNVHESAQFILARINLARYNVGLALLELDALAEHQGLRVGITEQRKAARAEREAQSTNGTNATPAA